MPKAMAAEAVGLAEAAVEIAAAPTVADHWAGVLARWAPAAIHQDRRGASRREHETAGDHARLMKRRSEMAGKARKAKRMKRKK
jgi:hypothetical protein